MAEIKDKIVTVESLGTVYNALISNISNFNMLVNGDFQVWQRGTNFTLPSNTSTYGADRWCAYVSAGGQVSKNANGLTFTSQNGTIKLTQKIDYCIKDADANTDYTLQVCIDNIVNIIKFNSITTSVQTVTCPNNSNIAATIYCPSSNDIRKTILEITINQVSGTVNWIKLERGSIATQFSPRAYADELDMCRRYYQHIGFSAPIVYKYHNKRIIIMLCFDQMRVTPAIKELTISSYDSSGMAIDSTSYEVNSLGYGQAILIVDFDKDLNSSLTGVKAWLALDTEFDK